MNVVIITVSSITNYKSEDYSNELDKSFLMRTLSTSSFNSPKITKLEQPNMLEGITAGCMYFPCSFIDFYRSKLYILLLKCWRCANWVEWVLLHAWPLRLLWILTGKSYMGLLRFFAVSTPPLKLKWLQVLSLKRHPTRPAICIHK